MQATPKSRSIRIGVAGAMFAILPALAFAGYSASLTQVEAANDSDLCVTATRADDSTVSAQRGWCSEPTPTATETAAPIAEPAVTATPTPTETTPPPAPTVGTVSSITEWGAPAGTGSQSGAWTDISTSSDGTKLTALRGTYYMTSTNQGATWTAHGQGGSNWNWSVLSTSADLAKTYIFPSNTTTSSDYNTYFWRGATFGGSITSARIGDNPRGFATATTSANGNVVLAANTNESRLLISSNGGSSFVYRGSFPTYTTWTDSTSSADGSKMAITSSYSGGQTMGYIYLSNDSGATWSRADSAGARRWSAIDSSADGQTIAATAGATGAVYVSKDGGINWTEQTVLGTSPAWSTISVSSDGTKISVGQNIATTGKLFTSTDGGATWNTSTTYGAGRWTKVEISANGNKIYAVKDGQFFTGNM